MVKSIFVSYASETHAVADQVVLSLRGCGFQVFFDRDNLQAGTSYDERIHREISSSTIFVFLISPESIAPGSYARTELKFAREKWPNPSRNVLPVMVQPTDLAQVPNYLKAVTILEPQGNIAAEVLAEVLSLTKSVKTTLNLPSSTSPVLRDRKGDFFLFSKCWSGSPAIGYKETHKWKANGVDPGLFNAIYCKLIESRDLRPPSAAA